MLEWYYPRNIFLIGFKLLMKVVFLILQDTFVDIKELHLEEIAECNGQISKALQPTPIEEQWMSRLVDDNEIMMSERNR